MIICAIILAIAIIAHGVLTRPATPEPCRFLKGTETYIMAVSQDVQDFIADMTGAIQGLESKVASADADKAAAVQAAEDAAAADKASAVQAVTDQLTQDHADEIAALKAGLAAATA